MPNEPSSPVCYMADADDIYMGYASRDEILKALNELLEAERAGAQVAQASSKLLPAGPYTGLMQAVRVDEARWCAVLARQIKRWDAIPSRSTGAFRGKALSIAEPLARLAFLNRGQAWVVRKLEALMPRVRDEDLYHSLKEMLECHRSNIERANILLQAEGAAR